MVGNLLVVIKSNNVILYCHYVPLFNTDGKGRGTKSLSAITSFASLMFISTLGKDLGESNEREDDMYGQLIRDILEEDGEDDDEDTENDKTMSESSDEKVCATTTITFNMECSSNT